MSSIELNEEGLALAGALHQANSHARSLLCDMNVDLAEIADACEIAALRFDEFAKHLEDNND